MKEIKDIYRSEHHKSGWLTFAVLLCFFAFIGVYSIELVNDENLYEWNVKLFKVDPDSLLATDMQTLAQEHKQDHLKFHFVFNENFPCEPPFVRLVSPAVSFFLFF